MEGIEVILQKGHHGLSKLSGTLGTVDPTPSLYNGGY